MSFAGALSSTVNSAVENSIKAGVVYAVAAGNNAADACNYSPTSVHHPNVVRTIEIGEAEQGIHFIASTPEALTVGSIRNLDGRSSFSNYSKCVDLLAPAETIRSAYF